MKTLVSLASVVKTVAAIAVLGMSFVSCNKEEDGLGAANAQDKKASLVITEKEEPKDSLWENSWVTVDNTVIDLDWQYFKNDTIVDSLKNSTNVAAQIQRDLEKVQTTVNHLNNLGISAGEVSESRDGKMNYNFRQVMTDLDGQTYNGEFKSGYATLKDLQNVHGKLVGFQTTGFRNIPQPTPEDMDTLVLTRVGWKAIFEVENAKNLAGQTFEISLDSTDHFRYIPKGAPQIVDRKPFQYKELGIWKSTWTFGYRYYWDNGTVTGDSMQVVLNASYETIELKDKVVGNLTDYSHADGSLKFKERTAAYSADSRIKKFDNRYEKESYATNGIENDKFHTLFAITVQDATAEFCDTTWTFKADEVAMTTTRNIFVDEDSDKDGYSMVRFTDTESAKYADGKGDNTVALKETCKLYMKVATPDVDKIEFVGTKIHADGKAKIDGSVIPVYSDGSKGAAIKFKFEKAESWVWLKDSVIAENVNFVMEETGTLKLKGSETKTAKTFATDNENITIKCNQYDADFQTTVKVDGQTKVTTWHATWYEDFKVVYSGKEVSLTKSSYSVKNQNDKLTKDEARSNATSEVWGYSVEGLFNIDEDSRSAMGYGRLTKAIEEEIVTEYWDKFMFQTDAHEYTDRVEYFLKWIREYNTGKKTSTDVKIVLKRNAEGSNYTITVEDPERVIGSQSENSILTAKSEKVDDIVINYDWKTSKFELPNVFDGKTTKNDIATFVDPTNVKVTKKNSKGEDVTIELPSFEHELTSTVSDLQKVSETEELVEYTYTRTWSWASNQCTSTVKSIGNINRIPQGGGGEPDFDIEVGSIYATVSRPSNRNGVNGDITAYTYLLVSKDGTKCLPIGIYHDVVTAGEITDMEAGFNSACYEKDQNKVVATRCELVDGIIQYYRHATGDDAVDAGMFMKWQAAGFNNRGNTFENWQHKYAPHATKKGNVTVVTFEGTNVSYTFRGWNVQ